MLEQVCEALDCAAVQQIGKLFVLWRARPPSADEPAPVEAAAQETARRGAAVIGCACRDGDRATGTGAAGGVAGHGPARPRGFGRATEAAHARQGPVRCTARCGAATAPARGLTRDVSVAHANRR